MLEPKEKAKELIWKYLPKIEGWKSEGKTILAKELALICVDEILNIKRLNDEKQTQYEDGSYGRSYYEVPNIYYTKVKQEIQKL